MPYHSHIIMTLIIQLCCGLHSLPVQGIVTRVPVNKNFFSVSGEKNPGISLSRTNNRIQ
jgi:hypothetical protein